jgi:hypothetical protein
MTTRGPYKRRKRLADQYRGLCACCEHAWAVLTKGFVTFVSPEDAHHLMAVKWQAKPNEGGLIYAVRSIGRKRRQHPLHRVILGEVPSDTDHVDHNGLNNRRNNLRPCTQNQNNGNSRQRVGVSGFRGVHIVNETGRWAAAIAHQRIGTFTTPEEAARAYDAAAVAHFGEFATLNFPLPPHSLHTGRA